MFSEPLINMKQFILFLIGSKFSREEHLTFLIIYENNMVLHQEMFAFIVLI